MANAIFGFDEPEDSPGLLLWQTTVVWQRLIKKSLDAYGISHAQFVILAISLWFEHQKTELTQSLIIHQSKLDKMTVSKSLKVLAAKGFIKRQEHKQDTRAKTIALTVKSKVLAEKLVPLVEKIDEDFFSAINHADRKHLLAIFKNLISNTGEAS